MTQPAASATTGAQRRRAPEPRKANTAMAASVTAALTGAAAGAASSGTSISMSNTMGMTVTAISMSTVPATVGVMRRRSRASRDESTNWKSAETNTSVASIPGPPSASAVTQTAMNVPDVPMSSG